MARIAVDIDDTLYSFAQLARKILASEGFRTGDERLISAAYAPWPEWRTPPDLLGLDKWLEVIDLCHDRDEILRQRPYEDSAKVLHELVAEGHELLYISNRKTETKEATYHWLFLHGFPIGDPEELVVTSDAKGPYIHECQYMIDDRPKTIVEFVHAEWAGETGDRKAFALMTEFNRALTDVPNIYLAPTWAGLRHYMTKKGLLKQPVVF